MGRLGITPRLPVAISGKRGDGRGPELLTEGLSGAVVGTIGAGGALPAGWTWTPLAGFTQAVLEIGTAPNGSPGIKLRINGTNSTGATGFPHLGFRSTAGGFSATPNQRYEYKIRVDTTAGGMTGFTSNQSQLGIEGFTAANAYLGAASSYTNVIPGTSQTFAHTLSDPTVGKVRPMMSMQTPNLAAIDWTFWITGQSFRLILA